MKRTVKTRKHRTIVSAQNFVQDAGIVLACLVAAYSAVITGGI